MLNVDTTIIPLPETLGENNTDGNSLTWFLYFDMHCQSHTIKSSDIFIIEIFLAPAKKFNCNYLPVLATLTALSIPIWILGVK